MEWRVESYVSIRGDRFVPLFMASLSPETRAKVVRGIDLLRTGGPVLGMPNSKKVSSHIYELRIRGTIQVRILYAINGRAIVLLHGLVKKSAKLPLKDLRVAEERLANI